MNPSNRVNRRLFVAATALALITQANVVAYLIRPGQHNAIWSTKSSNRMRASSQLPPNTNILFPSQLTLTPLRPNTRFSQVTRFYVDEWADADTELAFGPQNNHIPLNSRRVTPLFKRLMLQFASFLMQFRELVRTKIERCTVYILELENGKYYVGSTTNRKRRIQEHIKQRGSKWTRAHKPIRVLREYKRIPSKYVLGMESRITAECMLEFGVNNVRGSMFCGTREFHIGDVASLTKFIGHYNDLNYRKVSIRLAETLPVDPRRVRMPYNDGKCYRCGKRGHIAANCPERRSARKSHMLM